MADPPPPTPTTCSALLDALDSAADVKARTAALSKLHDTLHELFSASAECSASPSGASPSGAASTLVGAARDYNPRVAAMALACLSKLVALAGAANVSVAQFGPTVCDAAVDRCGDAKPALRQAARSAILALLEAHGPRHVVESWLSPMFGHRNPASRCGLLGVLAQAVEAHASALSPLPDRLAHFLASSMSENVESCRAAARSAAAAMAEALGQEAVVASLEAAGAPQKWATAVRTGQAEKCRTPDASERPPAPAAAVRSR